MSSFAHKTPEIFNKYPEVVAGITLRQGISPPYMDAPFHFRGLQGVILPEAYAQLEKAAIQNRQSLARLLGTQESTVSFVHQVHSNHVADASEGDVWGSTEADAIVGNTSNQLLGVFLADCAGILLYDPQAHVIGVAHSGWRGTRGNVIQKTIAKMKSLRANPTRIIAYISPTACPKHYQVGEEFADYFDGKFLPRTAGRLGFDNTAAITAQLQNEDVTQIQADPDCTIENPRLHSYRRDGLQSGRFVAFIGLRA